ncbi:MAG: hypothetical protein JW896_01715 [Deltaproteobacteria bacterium]|nr:hypothetical protein [Deltaproteobacteria bacterium]
MIIANRNSAMLVANRRNPWAISSLFFYDYESLKRYSLIHPEEEREVRYDTYSGKPNGEQTDSGHMCRPFVQP